MIISFSIGFLLNLDECKAPRHDYNKDIFSQKTRKIKPFSVFFGAVGMVSLFMIAIFWDKIRPQDNK